MLELEYFSLPFKIALLALGFICGACFGSFVNCIQMRVRDKKSIFGRSVCPNCGHTLGVIDLVPVFSYIFLRGKCRKCHEKISPRYLIVEILFGLTWVAVILIYGWSLITIEYLILFTILCAEALWDFDVFEVPDTLHILAIVNFLAFLFAHDNPLSRLLQGLIAGVIYGGAILIISLIMDKVYKKESIGGADIKLLFVLGLYYGWKTMLLLLILSCLIGFILAFVFKAGFQRAFPFIPALVISALICSFIAEPFIAWYIGLFSLNDAVEGAHIHTHN